MNDPQQKPDDLPALTRVQRAWRVLYWVTSAASALALITAVGLGFWWLIRSLDKPGPEMADMHPILTIAAALVVFAALIDFAVTPAARKRCPVTRRMIRRIERIANARRRKALGASGEMLIITVDGRRDLTPRLRRTQLVVRDNSKVGAIVVTIPALAVGADGQERRFALIRSKAPWWLTTAAEGYRFHARVNLAELEAMPGVVWGYVNTFERDSSDDRIWRS